MARKKVPLPVLLLGGLAVGLVGLRVLAPAMASGGAHPEPRPGITASAVQDPGLYSEYPEISRIYSEAATIPEILDGLYCRCDCSKHSQHRSLLSCFESDHAANCDACLVEADLAFRMHLDGASLEAIRDAADAMFDS